MKICSVRARRGVVMHDRPTVGSFSKKNIITDKIQTHRRCLNVNDTNFPGSVKGGTTATGVRRPQEAQSDTPSAFKF